jgi:hypothetical protein
MMFPPSLLKERSEALRRQSISSLRRNPALYRYTVNVLRYVEHESPGHSVDARDEEKNRFHDHPEREE